MMTSHVAPCARMCAVRDVLLLRAPVINLPRPVLCCAISGFDCRCGNLFCGLHRYSDKHNCPYDYKAEAADKIRKENPVVVADKIQRIWRGLSGWLWILGAIGLKKKKGLEPNLLPEGPVVVVFSPPSCLLHSQDFFPQCMKVHVYF